MVYRLFLNKILPPLLFSSFLHSFFLKVINAALPTLEPCSGNAITVLEPAGTPTPVQQGLLQIERSRSIEVDVAQSTKRRSSNRVKRRVAGLPVCNAMSKKLVSHPCTALHNLAIHLQTQTHAQCHAYKWCNASLIFFFFALNALTLSDQFIYIYY